MDPNSAEAKSDALVQLDVRNVTCGGLQFIFDQVEIWRPTSWPSYAVSSWGSVRHVRNGIVLQPGTTAGYPHVTLIDEGKRFTVRIHRLVADAFLGPAPFSGAEIAHNDGDSTNSRVGNLRWATRADNQADRIRHGTDLRGSAVFGAKLHEDDIPIIRARLARGERYPTIATDFGVSISTIHLIKHNRTWRHAGGQERAA